MTRTVAALLLVFFGTHLGAQTTAARPSIAVVVTSQEVAASDSTFAVNELIRSLQVDSLVEVLERPPQPGQVVRGARYTIAALLRQAAGGLRLDVRVFNTQTSQVMIRKSTTALATTRADSVRALGRRVASAIAAAAR